MRAYLSFASFPAVVATSTFLLVASTMMAMAQGVSSTPGRDLAAMVFGTMEDNPDGLLDLGEFMAFGDLIFVSMDYDEDESVDYDEFIAWDFGFDVLAEETGQVRAFQTAQKILFALWDFDGDRHLSRSEHRKAMATDFARADRDGNALLSEDEFLRNYIVNLAFRAALTGR